MCAVGAHDPPGVANREVFLADVNAVAARQPGQVHPIVEDQRNTRLRGQDANLARSFQQLAVRKALVAILDHVGAAGQGLAHDPGEITQRGETADQDHQPGIAQAPMGGNGGHDQLFDRVDVVTQDLVAAREPDVDQLAVFLQRSQGLGDPLEVRRQHGSRGLADPLGRGHDVRADVSVQYRASRAGAVRRARAPPAPAGGGFP